ncbi:Hsp20 family protein [Amycolatopsis panacis]|uniref:Hsp20 family protein n=1 Tax=Amycolatopsis panacis TaxID=2340917 RepID=UPI001F190DD6|nr:Hsp20 family protein [Amycolatopsis panacis]
MAVPEHSPVRIEESTKDGKNTGGHSDFRCSEFGRSVHLPAGTELAKYAYGILEVSMPSAGRPHEKRIQIHLDKD